MRFSQSKQLPELDPLKAAVYSWSDGAAAQSVGGPPLEAQQPFPQRLAMMGTIHIDDHVEPFPLPPGASVAEAFEAAREDVLRRGRIVVDVSLDDHALVWQDGSPEWETPFTDPMDLCIQTDEAIRLSTAILTQVMDLLPDIAEKHRQASAALRSGDTEEGVQKTLEVMPWWEELPMAITQICSLHGIEPGAPQWQDVWGQLGPGIHQITVHLREFREAADLQDFVLVADLLEYELAPLAEQWLEICRSFAASLKDRFPTQGGEQP